MDLQKTIVAVVTPQGVGAIGVLRLSGEEAVTIADKIFESKYHKKRLSEVKTHTVHLGFVKENDKIIDEALFTVFKAPQSYTGENVVEISCHGSVYIQKKIFELLLQNGATTAEPGEFTLRAYLNQKMDLSEAEAVADLIASESESAHKIALSQMRGGISKSIGDLRIQLIDFVSLIELELDFSEEDVAFADQSALLKLLDSLMNEIKSLLDSFTLGNAIKTGVPVAIVGAPNAGKSTLLNALLKEERAIVSSIEGTTRDTIEDEITLEGIKFRFIDTAGIRETTNEIESIGIQKTFEKIEQAKIVCYLFDAEKASQSLENLQKIQTEITALKEKVVDKPFIVIANKIDLITDNKLLENIHTQMIGISAKENTQIKALEKSLTKHYLISSEGSQSTLISNSRHFEALENALESILKAKQMLTEGFSGDLLAQELREALHHLGTITGKIDIDTDILGNIFGNFCIGK